MRYFFDILLTGLFIVLFVTMLPTLLWVVFLIIGVMFIFYLLRRIFGQKKQDQYTTFYEYKNSDSNIENESVNFDTYGQIKPDVIDVEYTETEEIE